MVTRRKRSKEKAVPQLEARAHEAGSPSASATGHGDVRSLQRLQGLTSMSSEGCVDDYLRHQDVQPHEEEGNERQPTMMALRKYITGLLPTTISVSNCSSFDFFILNLTTRLIQKIYIEISITF